MISRTHQLAILATLYLAQAPGSRPLSAGRIARGLGVPASYLAKVLHALAQAGVLDSNRGRRGGYRLARPAEQLSLREVTAPFAGPAGLHHCLLGREDCLGPACSIHGRWVSAIKPLNGFLRKGRLTDLLGGFELGEPGRSNTTP